MNAKARLQWSHLSKWPYFLLRQKVWNWTLDIYILHLDESSNKVKICYTSVAKLSVLLEDHSYDPR